MGLLLIASHGVSPTDLTPTTWDDGLGDHLICEPHLWVKFRPVIPPYLVLFSRYILSLHASGRCRPDQIVSPVEDCLYGVGTVSWIVTATVACGSVSTFSFSLDKSQDGQIPSRASGGVLRQESDSLFSQACSVR